MTKLGKPMIVVLVAVASTGEAQVAETRCCTPDPTLDLFSACVLGGGPRPPIRVLPSQVRELWGGESIILQWNTAPKATCATGFVDSEKSLDLMDIMCERDVLPQHGQCVVDTIPGHVPELWCETFRAWFNCLDNFDFDDDGRVDLYDYATLQNEWQGA